MPESIPTKQLLVDEREPSCRDASEWVARRHQPPRVIADQLLSNHTLVGWLCVYSLLGCLILGASITARMFGRVMFQVLG